MPGSTAPAQLGKDARHRFRHTRTDGRLVPDVARGRGGRMEVATKRVLDVTEIEMALEAIRHIRGCPVRMQTHRKGPRMTRREGSFDRRFIGWSPRSAWDASRLKNRLQRQAPRMFAFLEHASVEPTNNASERALRYMVFRKIIDQAKGDLQAMRRLAGFTMCVLTWRRQSKRCTKRPPD